MNNNQEQQPRQNFCASGTSQMSTTKQSRPSFYEMRGTHIHCCVYYHACPLCILNLSSRGHSHSSYLNRWLRLGWAGRRDDPESAFTSLFQCQPLLWRQRGPPPPSTPRDTSSHMSTHASCSLDCLQKLPWGFQNIYRASASRSGSMLH